MSDHDANLTTAQEADIATIETIVRRLTDPGEASPAQALWAVSQILGAARVRLRPFEFAFLDVTGEAREFWVPGNLFNIELALNNAAERAGGRPARPAATGDREPAPRYMGTAEVGRHFGVRQTTVSNWLRRFPASHPAIPTPEPAAAYMAWGGPRPLWIAGEWEPWETWHAAFQVAAAAWLKRFAVKDHGPDDAPGADA